MKEKFFLMVGLGLTKYRIGSPTRSFIPIPAAGVTPRIKSRKNNRAMKIAPSEQIFDVGARGAWFSSGGKFVLSPSSYCRPSKLKSRTLNPSMVFRKLTISFPQTQGLPHYLLLPITALVIIDHTQSRGGVFKIFIHIHRIIMAQSRGSSVKTLRMPVCQSHYLSQFKLGGGVGNRDTLLHTPNKL